jgi:hypothetical protein
MTCPDTECHENVQELKKDMKSIRLCVSKKVKRWELWIVVFSIATLLSPFIYSSFSKSSDWKKKRELRSTENKMAIEIIAIGTQKDITNINEKINLLQGQQERLPDQIYDVVKKAINDSERRR